jgi:putative RNA 2'-phosphotransferase
MNRQFVHLSADRETAHDVGRRKASRPVILVIDAAGAHSAGIDFYHGNQMIWLAEHIPPAYISQTEGADT